MEINWLPGKTEMILKYVGMYAAMHYKKRRDPESGKLQVEVKGAGVFINVVSQYKHLGGITH